MRRLIWSAILTAAVALSACSGATSNTGAFQLAEFSISGPSRLAGGARTLTVENIGEFPHTLVVTTESGDVVAATNLVEPGGSAALRLDLDPGRYRFTCRIVTETDDGRIVDHFEAGMNTVVDVTG